MSDLVRVNADFATVQPEIDKFDNAPPDLMRFDQGREFVPKKLTELLDLSKEDVSRLSGVPLSALRYYESIPTPVCDRLADVADTINMVASLFAGDLNKTAAWLRAINPMLGDIAPRDMIRLGKYEQLHQFVTAAIGARRGQPIEP